MTASSVLHNGPRAPSEIAYDLTAEQRAGRWDDWRRDATVQAGPEATAAERLATGAELASLHAGWLR